MSNSLFTALFGDVGWAFSLVSWLGISVDEDVETITILLHSPLPLLNPSLDP